MPPWTSLSSINNAVHLAQPARWSLTFSWDVRFSALRAYFPSWLANSSQDSSTHLTDVMLQVGLPQALAGANRQRGNTVRSEPNEGSCRRRLQSFNIQVPKNSLPTLRQRFEGLGHDARLKVAEEGVVVQHWRIQDGIISRCWHSPRLAVPVMRGSPHHRQEVGTEELRGALTFLQQLKDRRERPRPRRHRRHWGCRSGSGQHSKRLSSAVHRARRRHPCLPGAPKIRIWGSLPRPSPKSRKPHRPVPQILDP